MGPKSLDSDFAIPYGPSELRRKQPAGAKVDQKT